MDRFEKLVKDMAGMNRRDALRRAGGGLAGLMLAAFGVGRAQAQEDNFCEYDCEVLFGLNPNTDRPKWGRCMQSCSSCLASGGGTCDNFFNNFRHCESTFGGGNSQCYCFTTVEGDAYCGANWFCNNPPFGNAPTCSSSDECGPGFVCSTSNGCTFCTSDFGVCAPTCIVSPYEIYTFPPTTPGTSPASGQTAIVI
jgi:hypothetical protein